ncbi:MAG: DUF167 domain-containing protein [Pseudomonadales bacterium]|jgi:uncharacterized protein (TIGR00251 family)|nr:DUF167 domain-containing protein [Pseudomonadales bacterium]
MQIRVKVMAGSKKPRLMQRNNDEFTVRTVEPATDGEANKVVHRMLAEYLGIKKSQLVLISGENNREKIFEIQGR